MQKEKKTKIIDEDVVNDDVPTSVNHKVIILNIYLYNHTIKTIFIQKQILC